MNVEICSQHTMPVYTMSMGVFLLNQCPMWAKFAAVDHDGSPCGVFEHETENGEWVSINATLI